MKQVFQIQVFCGEFKTVRFYNKDTNELMPTQAECTQFDSVAEASEYVESARALMHEHDTVEIVEHDIED